MQTTFIYGLECPLTKEIRYVGKSNNPKNRVRQHLYESEHGRSYNKYKHDWFNTLKEYSLRPNMIILDEVPLYEWGYWERWWLQTLRGWGFNMTNLLEGGDGCSEHSKETIEKLRKLQSGKNNSMYGKPPTSGMLGKTHSEESRKKISDSKKGEKNVMYGKTHSEDTKEKMRKPKKVGSINGRSKITPDEVRYIRRLLKDGLNTKQVSDKLNIGRTTIKNIKQDKTWKWVE